MSNDNYIPLIIVSIVGFIVGYLIILVILVDKFSHITDHLNKVYAAMFTVLIMAAVELAIMLYRSYSTLTLSLFVLFIILSFVMGMIIRKQIGINEEDFLLSMIEYNAIAVRMIKANYQLKDPRIKVLANKMLKSQEADIQSMQRILKRRGKTF